MASHWIELLSDQLTRRQRAGVLGAAVTLLLAFYGVLLQPLLRDYRELSLTKQHLQLDNQWLREQVPLLQRLGNHCPSVTAETGVPRNIIISLARRNLLTVLDVQQSLAGELSLQMTSDDGNRLLQFIYQSTCQGLRLTSMSLTTDRDKTARIHADMKVRYD